MRRILILLLIVFLAVVLGIGLVKIPGVLLLELGQKTFAAPLWFVVVSLVILVLVIYFVAKLFCWVVHLPFEWRNSWLNFKHKRRERLFKEALDAQVLGDHAHAWVKFRNLAKSHYLIPQTYYLAAHSAEIAGESAMAMDLLSAAGRTGASHSMTFILLQVDKLIKEGNFQEAKNKLAQIPKELIKNPNVIKRALIIAKHPGR